MGHHVTGIDRDAAALAQLPSSVRAITADIENAPWPLTGQQFDAVIVTNYLWRTLFSNLLACVQTGGIFIYETFAQGNEHYGKPSRPDFLLHAGELLQQCAPWHVVAYEHGWKASPERIVQRIVAINTSTTALKAYPLEKTSLAD